MSRWQKIRKGGDLFTIILVIVTSAYLIFFFNVCLPHFFAKNPPMNAEVTAVGDSGLTVQYVSEHYGDVQTVHVSIWHPEEYKVGDKVQVYSPSLATEARIVK